MTSPKCLRQTKWLVALQDLIQDAYWQQDDPDVKDMIQQWKDEKEVLRKNLKGLRWQISHARTHAYRHAHTQFCH